MSATIFTVEELTLATNNFDVSRLVGAGGCGGVRGRGVSGTRTSFDDEAPPPLRRVCLSIPPQGTSRKSRGTSDLGSSACSQRPSCEGVLGSGQRVAVKRWRGGASAQGLAELMNEVTILSQMDHLNVLPLLGFCCRPPDLMLVTPYLARGSLHDALYGEGAGGAGARGPRGAAWRVTLVAGIAHGIHALHAAQVVHRDIKSANVLVSDSHDAADADGPELPVAKLADAGVARRMRRDAASAALATPSPTRVIGTDGYLDPEYQDTERLAYKSDVFSFGVILLEVEPGRYCLPHHRNAFQTLVS